jgi:hypothetical protein
MRILLILLSSLFSTCLNANSLKVDSLCRQTANGISVHVPITQRNASTKATYKKLLHIECASTMNSSCYGIVLYTDIPESGIGYLDMTPIIGMVTKVNREGYVVFEWGINLITVDFQNQKLTWVELSGDKSSTGYAVCK